MLVGYSLNANKILMPESIRIIVSRDVRTMELPITYELVYNHAHLVEI